MFTRQLFKAAFLLYSLKERKTHPSGSFDKGGRWYPDDSERAECCDSIRCPSRSHPYSYMVHCRTAKHVSILYNIQQKDLNKCLATFISLFELNKIKIDDLLQQLPEEFTEDDVICTITEQQL